MWLVGVWPVANCWKQPGEPFDGSGKDSCTHLIIVSNSISIRTRWREKAAGRRRFGGRRRLQISQNRPNHGKGTKQQQKGTERPRAEESYRLRSENWKLKGESWKWRRVDIDKKKKCWWKEEGKEKKLLNKNFPPMRFKIRNVNIQFLLYPVIYILYYYINQCFLNVFIISEEFWIK